MEKKNKEKGNEAATKEKDVASHDCKCNKDCGCCEKKEQHVKSPSNKTSIVALMMLLSVTLAFGQTPGEPSFWSDPINSPLLPLYATLTVIAATVLLLIAVLVYVLRVFNIIIQQVEKERAVKLGLPVVKKLTWWEKFWQKINALAPIENEHDLDTGHDFDGIRELDNHLPPWWTGLFYATVIWGVVYLVVYHVTDSMPLSGDEYQNELAEAEVNARVLQASRPAEVIDAKKLEYNADQEIIGRGRIVFTSSNCGSCHRNDGGGNTIGPNLVDDYWLHGGSIGEIYSTIKTGFVEKGMPAWGKTMSPKDVRDVAFFVMSLKGTNPPNAKAPQGNLHKPAVVLDSANVQAMNN
jgi:cytochrome c oxidase cbb3-type subunit 3